jgi:hypothetical protein
VGFFCAFLFVAFFFTTSLYIAAHRLFWFDEVMTMLIICLDLAKWRQDFLRLSDWLPVC